MTCVATSSASTPRSDIDRRSTTSAFAVAFFLQFEPPAWHVGGNFAQLPLAVLRHHPLHRESYLWISIGWR